MTQELLWLVVAGAGLFMPMLLGLLRAGRRPVPVRASRGTDSTGPAQRRR
ncbi:hypothetical protein [Microterricola gilva]|nr:hypothetical protein [Microterricola gilva]